VLLVASGSVLRGVGLVGVEMRLLFLRTVRILLREVERRRHRPLGVFMVSRHLSLVGLELLFHALQVGLWLGILLVLLDRLEGNQVMEFLRLAMRGLAVTYLL